ncbi:MAG: GNAT family N-acetyltransferase [Alphaproteobacteria bacterium]|nr:GNAT family N-acetyltransferase [Alphaproteobacteria bacterium]
MFARTKRLLLRPGWREDAPALFRAVADEGIARNLARLPWPYRMEMAEEWLAQPQDPAWPSSLIFLRRDGTPELVGGIGVHRSDEGGAELGYWIARARWGQGIATEAGRAMIAAARDTLRLPRLGSGHFVDNPASGRVLEKLGFRPTGRVVPRQSLARGHEVPCRLLELDLAEEDTVAIAA